MKQLCLSLVMLCLLMLLAPSCHQPNEPEIPETPSDTLPEIKDETLQFTLDCVSFTMVRVEGGTFMMGALAEDTLAYNNEKPAHSVTLSSYYIGETEVTQALWVAVMNDNPSYFANGDMYPVESVGYETCQTFISRLNSSLAEQLSETNLRFRLPTEAEWEFAARGGNQSKGYLYSGSNNIDEVAWYEQNSGYGSTPVASLQPNELGLYDMTGNVKEWCFDWFDETHYFNTPSCDPQGASEGENHVTRGGGWFSSDRDCRNSHRGASEPLNTESDHGLRLVLAK